MKLDYLQFLELEVFTRFGARLEAGVEAKIKRGRLLRELLKQDRLSPLTPEQHMAWLIAFNDSKFDPQTQPLATLQKLLSRVSKQNMAMTATREAWLHLIEQDLQEAQHEPAS